MPYRPFEDQNCSIARALAVIGERWTLLVLREVLLGRRHFQEIRRNTGIASNILSDRLQTLVEHGVVERTEAGEYRPTAKGNDAMPVLVTLMQWGDAHGDHPDGPPRVPVHRSCGHDAHPELRCAHCGERITARDLQIRPGPGATERQRTEPMLPA